MKHLLVFIIVQLILLQFADGYLTYLGVSQHGPDIEGNPIIKFMIIHMGTIPALVTAKGLCILLCLWFLKGSTLDSLDKAQSKFLIGVLGFVYLFYLIVIVAWLIILLPTPYEIFILPI